MQCSAAATIAAPKRFPRSSWQVVRFLATTTATSLLEKTEDDWRTQIGRPAPKDNNPRALLIYARRRVEDLADAGGWEAEYPRDVWQLRRLGFPGNQTLAFDAIGQPWLRGLVKRWLRWRMERIWDWRSGAAGYARWLAGSLLSFL